MFTCGSWKPGRFGEPHQNLFGEPPQNLFGEPPSKPFLAEYKNLPGLHFEKTIADQVVPVVSIIWKRLKAGKMRKVYKGNCQHLVKHKQKHHRKHKVKVLNGEDAYLPMRISRHLLKMTSCLLFSNTTVLLQMYSMPPSWPIWVAMAPGWGWMGRSAHHHHCYDHEHHHHHQVIIMTHDS